ncbi:MAG: DUF2892 domain-containing protein [Saprospiraceae bacterium]|nr:DUF2892 domain-containing protein [Saprospiraceae bacterium]
MTKNMGTADRVIRLIIAAIAVFLYSNGTLTGTWGIVAIVVAIIFALTSMVGFCPLYKVVGISSCPVPANKRQ